MQLTIMPTEKCNFRCVYCYEDFKIGKMKQETLDGIKALISQSAPELKKLIIQWFGGEPTLNPKGIKEISEHIVALQKEYGFLYKAHMTTNAYVMDKAMFSEFVDLGIIDYQISLDGMPEQHNKTRIKANGDATFDTIWKNLCSYQEIKSEFNIVFRLHVMQENSQSMLELSKKIREQFGQDHRYMSFIRNIANLGGSSDEGVDKYVPNEKKKLDDLIEEMSQIMTTDKHKSHKKQGKDPYICYAAMPRHLTIRADGRLAKCTVAFDDDRNDLGRINPDGTLKINGEKFELWTRGFSSLNLKELACPNTNLPTERKYKEDKIEVTMV